MKTNESKSKQGIEKIEDLALRASWQDLELVGIEYAIRAGSPGSIYDKPGGVFLEYQSMSANLLVNCLTGRPYSQQLCAGGVFAGCRKAVNEEADLIVLRKLCQDKNLFKN